MAIEDFKRIVESLGIAVAIADAKGAIVFVNAAFAGLVGRDSAALDQAPLASLFKKDDQKRVQQNIARVGEGKAASAFVDVQLALDHRWVQVSLQPAREARDSKSSGVIALMHDIGSQRETEQALNVSGARLLALAEASPVPAMIENAAGEIELANEAFCRLLGIESAPQSLTGMPVKEVFARAPRLDRKSIERQPLVIDGAAAGALWAPRQQAAHGESGAQGAAQIALIEKIGMELSVAMEGIAAISIRAQQMEFDPAMVEHFQRIRTSTETAVAAIGDLIDFSKLSGGGVVLHKSQFRLRAALADLIARVWPNAEEHGCTLRIKVEQDVADSVEGDVERLLLVLKNLLDNAFVLLPGAEITLQITPEYVTESGIQLSFGVIAAGEAAKHPAKASADSGMGVAVARFMVAAMGGKLTIAARPGADALYAFTIEFPVRPPPPQPPRATYDTLLGLPVLVVSGDPEQRLHLANVLRGLRLVPLEADNASMGIALLERMHEEGSPVPLVILSNKLAGQDGFLLAFRIRHHPSFRSTLVMMLATGGKPGDAIACRENGIAAYMRYPINDRQLHEAITAVTGASMDAEETTTLVTRHSLRESRKGATILLVDANRDSQILAAHILGRQDCSLVVAHDLDEAFAALDQDVYELVVVDTALPGLGGNDAARLLRARITREPEATALVAASTEHSPAYSSAKTAIGFNTTVAKPFRKDDLLALLATVGRQPVEA